MSDPHSDPAVAKVPREKISTVRCGECVEKISAPPAQLADAYQQHTLVCRSPR